MLKTRIVTAFVVIAVLLGAIFLLPSRLWGLAALAVVAAAAHEWASLARYTERASMLFVGGIGLVGLSLLFNGAIHFDHGWTEDIILVCCGTAAAFWALVVPLWLLSGRTMRSKLGLGLVGAVVLLATWVAVVELQARSPWLLLAFLAVVWCADTAAFFVGRRFGRHKLAPRISPGKTWEGVYGAFGAAVVYGLVLWTQSARAGYTGSHDVRAVAGWIGIVLLLTFLSIVGDLFESHLKRARGVKDSGTILPGHGGILDRIDALLAAMPAAALVAFYLVR